MSADIRARAIMKGMASTVFITGAAGVWDAPWRKRVSRSATRTWVLVDVAPRVGKRRSAPTPTGGFLRQPICSSRPRQMETTSKALGLWSHRRGLQYRGRIPHGPGGARNRSADWNFLFDLNAKTVLHVSRRVACCARAAREDRERRRVCGAERRRRDGAYIASKSAVIRITEER